MDEDNAAHPDDADIKDPLNDITEVKVNEDVDTKSDTQPTT